MHSPYVIREENKQLKERIDQIKPITIENINYKIQELSVQQLSGTLNIGMSALTDPEEIRKWLNTEEDAPNDAPDLTQQPYSYEEPNVEP